MKRFLPALVLLCAQFFFGCSYDLIKVDFLDLQYSTPGRMVNTDNTDSGWHGSVSMNANTVKRITGTTDDFSSNNPDIQVEPANTGNFSVTMENIAANVSGSY